MRVVCDLLTVFWVILWVLLMLVATVGGSLLVVWFPAPGE